MFLDEHKKGRIDWNVEEDLGLNELFNVHTVVEEKEEDLVAPEEFLELKACEKEIEPEIELSTEMKKTFVELAKKILKNSAKNYKNWEEGLKWVNLKLN